MTPITLETVQQVANDLNLDLDIGSDSRPFVVVRTRETNWIEWRARKGDSVINAALLALVKATTFKVSQRAS